MAPDVAADPRSGLLARDRLSELPGEETLELEPAELFGQIGRRLLAPCPAPAPELRRGEHLDHLPEPGLLGPE